MREHDKWDQELSYQAQELSRMATVVRDSNDAITIQDLEGNITAWNSGATKIYGYSEQEAIKINAADLVPGELKSEALNFIVSLKKGDLIESLETKRETKDGKILDIWMVVTKLVDKDGKLIGIATTERDITERKQTYEALKAVNHQLTASSQQLRASEQQLKYSNQELQASDQQLRAANQQLNASNQQLMASQKEIESLAKFPSENPNPVLRISKDGIILFANEAAEKVLKSWDTTLNCQAPERWQRIIAEALETDSVGLDEDMVAQQVFSFTISPVKDAGYVNLYARDISELKQSEEARHLSDDKYESIFKNLIAGCCYNEIIYKDGIATDYRILDANQSYENILGIPRSEVIGKLASEVYKSDKIPLIDIYARVAETGIPETYEVYFPPADKFLNITTTCPGKGKFSNTFVDITKRKQAEEKSREHEKLLGLFFSQSLDGFFFMMFDEPVLWDDTVGKDKVLDYVFAHQRMTRVNDAMLNQYGAAREKFIGLTPNDFYSHDLACGKDLWRRMFDEGKLHIETDERKLDGTQMWIEGDYICLYDNEGRITGHFGIQRDITERKQAEEDLVRTKTLLSETEKTAKIGGWIVDLETMTQTWTEETYRLHEVDMDFEPDVSKGINFYAPSSKPIIERAFNHTVETGEPFDLELEIITAKGNRIWVHSVGKAQQVDGVTKVVSGSFQDITEHKLAELQLAESESRYRELFRNISSGVTVCTAEDCGRDFVIKDFNPSGERIEKIKREDCVGRKVTEVFPGIEEFGLLEVFRRVWRTGEPEYFPAALYKDERISGWRENYVCKLPSDEIVSIYDDVTEHKLAEQKLQQYRENLERMVESRTKELTAVNKELEAFAYSVSHNLRAPLRSINGFSYELLNDYADKLDDAGKDYLRRICAASRHMGNLIEDMLSLTQLNRKEMAGEKVDLAELASGIIGSLKKLYPDRDVTFTAPDSAWVEGDPVLLKSLMQNLIENAWKFSSNNNHAKIEFDARQQDGQIVYSVRDDGAGFDMEYSGKLFRPFQRLHTADEFPGTGIGLATAKRVVNRHNGRIWTESEAGKGAVFHFTLG